jgi:predicted phosphodiesterase
MCAAAAHRELCGRIHLAVQAWKDLMYISPDVIGLIGDCHGNLNFATKAVRELAKRGITDIHFLGDFGFVFHGLPAERVALAALDQYLSEAGATAYITGGNHENYDLWNQFEPDQDGVRWATEHIGLLPRGWRAATPTGRIVGSLGGANSIDYRQRVYNRLGWWPGEQITDADLAALGTQRVDVLLGHDAPMSQRLTNRLIPSEHLWDPEGLEYSKQGQAMFHRGFLQVRPSVVFSGHYHQFVDTTEEFVDADGEAFTARSVVLNMEGRYPSLAALEVSSLSVEFIQFDQAPLRGWTAYEVTPA